MNHCYQCKHAGKGVVEGGRCMRPVLTSPEEYAMDGVRTKPLWSFQSIQRRPKDWTDWLAWILEIPLVYKRCGIKGKYFEPTEERR